MRRGGAKQYGSQADTGEREERRTSFVGVDLPFFLLAQFALTQKFIGPSRDTRELSPLAHRMYLGVAPPRKDRRGGPGILSKPTVIRNTVLRVSSPPRGARPEARALQAAYQSVQTTFRPRYRTQADGAPTTTDRTAWRRAKTEMVVLFPLTCATSKRSGRTHDRASGLPLGEVGRHFRSGEPWNNVRTTDTADG